MAQHAGGASKGYLSLTAAGPESPRRFRIALPSAVRARHEARLHGYGISIDDCLTPATLAATARLRAEHACLMDGVVECPPAHNSDGEILQALARSQSGT